MEQATLDKCQKLVGYTFQCEALLAVGLTHSSVAATRQESNERMEFLGDAVLGLVVCHQLYQRHADLSEGQMTKIKSAVVSRQTCAEISDKLGISDLLYLGKGVSHAQIPSSMAAAVFESVIGAIYLDGGLEPAKRFILHNVQPFIDEALANEHQSNYKSLLQQYAQRHWGGTPEYQVLDEKGPDHSKCFEVGVTVEGRNFPSAWGMSKKEAEQEAARLALEQLGLLSAGPAGPE